ncbi:MAG TPA: hypothetical protein P5050_03720 [Bacteroidia bacterium]|nr:hypothetical protein [Bacteroidia bacterium]HRS58308.1 hypothetical protein [Bacteroidia bacterium]HRU68982.1 hypothetical protein [Bacteroidia bacterium]
MRKSFIVLFFLLSARLFAQNLNPEYFDKIVFNSDFKSSRDLKLWPIANDEDEIMIISNGQYLIERKNNTKDRFIFPNWQNPYPNYELSVNLTLEKLVFPYQVAGVCFQFNSSLTDGLILEFNKSKQFRIRKINENGIISYLTGSTPNNSWKKCNYLLMKGEMNDLNILVNGNKIEIYINNYFIYSFENESNFNLRNFGLFVGKSSQITFQKIQLLVNHKEYGKYDYLLSIKDVKEPEVTADTNTQKNDVKKEADTLTEKPNQTTGSSDNKELTEALALIVRLKKDLSAKEKELETQKQLLEKCKNDNLSLNAFIESNLDNKTLNRITELEKENNKLKDQLQKLKTENATLQDFKTFYLNQNKDKDIINFLYDELKKLEEKNASLSRQVEMLQNQLKNLKK